MMLPTGHQCQIILWDPEETWGEPTSGLLDTYRIKNTGTLVLLSSGLGQPTLSQPWLISIYQTSINSKK